MRSTSNRRSRNMRYTNTTMVIINNNRSLTRDLIFFRHRQTMRHLNNNRTSPHFRRMRMNRRLLSNIRLTISTKAMVNRVRPKRRGTRRSNRGLTRRTNRRIPFRTKGILRLREGSGTSKGTCVFRSVFCCGKYNPPYRRVQAGGRAVYTFSQRKQGFN